MQHGVYSICNHEMHDNNGTKRARETVAVQGCKVFAVGIKKYRVT